MVDLCYEKEAAHFYRGRPATLAFSRSAPLTQLSTRLPPPSPPTAVQLLSAPTCSAAQKIYPARILPWSQGRSVLPRLLPTCQAVQPPSPTLHQPLSSSQPSLVGTLSFSFTGERIFLHVSTEGAAGLALKSASSLEIAPRAIGSRGSGVSGGCGEGHIDLQKHVTPVCFVPWSQLSHPSCLLPPLAPCPTGRREKGSTSLKFAAKLLWKF